MEETDGPSAVILSMLWRERLQRLVPYLVVKNTLCAQRRRIDWVDIQFHATIAHLLKFIMAVRQPPAILFYRCSLDLSFFFLAAYSLRVRLADRHHTLPRVPR